MLPGNELISSAFRLEQRKTAHQKSERRSCWKGGPGWAGHRRQTLEYGEGGGVRPAGLEKEKVYKGESCNDLAKVDGDGGEESGV